MNDDQRSLRDIAQAASDRHGGAKGRELDRVAKKAGLRLSYTTFDRILSGTYTSVPSAATIEALAVLAGADPREVYAAAGRPYPLGRFADQLPDDADLLDGAQREAVIAVVRQFAAANRALHEAKGGGGHDGPAATSSGVGGPGNNPDGSAGGAVLDFPDRGVSEDGVAANDPSGDPLQRGPGEPDEDHTT